MTNFDRLCLPYCLEWVNGSQLTHSLWHCTCYKLAETRGWWW